MELLVIGQQLLQKEFLKIRNAAGIASVKLNEGLSVKIEQVVSSFFSGFCLFFTRLLGHAPLGYVPLNTAQKPLSQRVELIVPLMPIIPPNTAQKPLSQRAAPITPLDVGLLMATQENDVSLLMATQEDDSKKIVTSEVVKSTSTGFSFRKKALIITGIALISFAAVYTLAGFYQKNEGFDFKQDLSGYSLGLPLGDSLVSVPGFPPGLPLGEMCFRFDATYPVKGLPLCCTMDRDICYSAIHDSSCYQVTSWLFRSIVQFPSPFSISCTPAVS